MRSYCCPRVRSLLGVLFLSSLILCLWLNQLVTAQSSNPDQLVQQGIDRYQAGNYPAAIVVLQTALTQYRQSHDSPNTAIVLENIARTSQQLGQSDQAIAYWQQAINLYQQLGNSAKLGRALTEQAQAYTNLGQPKTAIALLCHEIEPALDESTNQSVTCVAKSALQLAQATQDKELETAALGSLGEAYRLLGEYEAAIDRLKSTLTLAETLGNKPYQISALNSLANALTSRAQLNYRRAQSDQHRQDTNGAEKRKQSAKNDDEQALKHLEASLTLAQSQKDAPAQMRSLLSTLPIYTRQKDERARTSALLQAVSLWETLPNTRSRIYAGIDLARFLQSSSCTANPAETILQKATDSAHQIQDHRAESFALGALGKLYECRGMLTQALEITQQAILVAEQDLKAKDSLYQWEWQTGRILKALSRKSEAIAAYNRSIGTLDTIRSDILSANRDLQFDFRDTIEPIYRDLIALQLSLEDKPISENNGIQSAKLETQVSKLASGNLVTVLNTMDSLRLAELQNYFGSECILTAINPVNAPLIQEQPRTAIVNSIVLDNSTVMILKLHNQALLRFPVNLSQGKLEQKVDKFRQRLEDYQDKAPFNLQESQELYDLLVKPFAPALKEQNITTLVFVQDGILRSIPMAALHDGKQFLVESYAIATTPSLSLTTLTPLDRGNLRALGLGITQATIVEGKSFSSLEYVKGEIDGLTKQLLGSQSLLDQEFQRDRLKQVLNQTSFPIIHIATHGQFGADPNDTFLVTGDRSQNKLTIADLDRLLRRVAKNKDRIDLLMLTACQTAVGDDRSTLGLAGVALQAGAKSAIASLWFISDEATGELTNSFYNNLPKMSRAEALQTAQRELIKSGKTPAYWSAFVLVGSWL